MERNRIQSLFERLGWETLGGTAYHYPKLGAQQPTEDWFNHVIPALMLIRSYIVESGRELTRFTLDVQSTTGMNPAAGFGNPPLPSNQVTLYPPGNMQFGEGNLKTWLDQVTAAFPY